MLDEVKAYRDKHLGTKLQRVIGTHYIATFSEDDVLDFKIGPDKWLARS